MLDSSKTSLILEHPDAFIRLNRSLDRWAIDVTPRNGLFVAMQHWDTKYPLDLIRHVLRTKGPTHLCDEIRRDEDEFYISQHFQWDIFSYVPPSAFRGGSVLDFGSGCGASTIVLKRMLGPDVEIVGVERDRACIEVARHRAAFYGVENRVRFIESPDTTSFPRGIGQFDAVMLSAVFEHLLPKERQSLLPAIWEKLKPGGILFIDQTPYRWFPIERHTTGIPLLNYLPDRLAHWTALRFCRRLRDRESWEELLRRGIRGATAREIMDILTRRRLNAECLQPCRNGVIDHIDLWYRLSSSTRMPLTKTVMMIAMRTIKAFTGMTMIPTLSLAIRKID